MPLEMIVLHFEADRYHARLSQRFPDITFHAFHHGHDALGIADRVEVIMGLDHHIPRELIWAFPKLKWIQALTTGTDTLTQPGMMPPHVLLTSTRAIHGPQMSELAFVNMIALARDFRKMQRNQAQAKWEQWGQPILDGKTIVFVGLGLLAEHLAERCRLFGMHVIGVSGGRTGSVPHFDEVVSRKDLAKVLDVFLQQPLPPDSPLWTMPNVIITPNIGGRSNVFVEQTLTIIEPNVAAYKEGRLKDLRNIIAR